MNKNLLIATCSLLLLSATANAQNCVPSHTYNFNGTEDYTGSAHGTLSGNATANGVLTALV